MDVENRVIEVVQALLRRHKRPIDGVARNTTLYHGGLGLDSLGAAELSTMLEMAFSRDPYSEGEIPNTVGDIVDFYQATPRAARP